MNEYNHKKFMDWLNGELEKENIPDNNLLIEAKLSKYWKVRAKRRAINAERQWPNKTDRDWALEQQTKSEGINSSIYKLFEKDLEESEDLSSEAGSVIKNIKNKRKKIKEKQIAKKFGPGTPNKPKGSISVPLGPEYGGVAKGYKKKLKKLAKKGIAGVAPGEAFGPAEE